MGCASSSNSLSNQVVAASSIHKSNLDQQSQNLGAVESTIHKEPASILNVSPLHQQQPQTKRTPVKDHLSLALKDSAAQEDFSKSNNHLCSLPEFDSDMQMNRHIRESADARLLVRARENERSQREVKLNLMSALHIEDDHPSRYHETEKKQTASRREEDLNAVDKSVKSFKSSFNKQNCNNSILNTSLEKIKHLRKRMSSKRGYFGAEHGEVSLLSVRNVMSREDNILDRTSPNIFFGLHHRDSHRINEKQDEQSDSPSEEKEEKADAIRQNTNNISLQQERGSVSHHSKRKNDFLSISMYIHPKNEDKYSERKSIIYQDIMKTSKRKAIPNILSGFRNRSTERISERIIKKKKKGGKAGLLLPLIPVSQDHSINSLEKLTLPPIKPRASFGTRLVKEESKANPNRITFDANFSMVDNSVGYRNIIEESLSNSYGSSMLSPVAGKGKNKESRSKHENILQFNEVEQMQGPAKKLITIKRTVKLTEPKQDSSLQKNLLFDNSPIKKVERITNPLTPTGNEKRKIPLITTTARRKAAVHFTSFNSTSDKANQERGSCIPLL